jgi:hypothetical protein
MIVLRSQELLVRLDPRHGGEILDLVDLRSGRQLLGRPPFAATEPVAGDLDEKTWTAAYRGGWQLLVPNAGNACRVDGSFHGFHGRASNDPWSLRALEDGSATLEWAGHGLAVERRVRLADGAVAVSVEARAHDRRVALLAVEHIALGLDLLDPEVAIDVAGGRAFELDEATGPPSPPADAAEWPDVRLRDGSTERLSRWPLERERSRLLCVADVPAGRVTVANEARGVGVELTWSAEWLRHLWMWHEVRTYGGPWRRRAELLVIEPASVPHSLGLAAALEHGQARWLEPGESCGYELVARPFSTGGAAA